MTASTALLPLGKILSNAYDFKDAKQLVDVGGNHGVLLAEILRLNPHLKGICFDQVSISSARHPLSLPLLPLPFSLEQTLLSIRLKMLRSGVKL